jgi:hypothetical protein
MVHRLQHPLQQPDLPFHAIDVAALLLALPSAQYDHMPRETRQTHCNGLQVRGALGYDDR